MKKLMIKIVILILLYTLLSILSVVAYLYSSKDILYYLLSFGFLTTLSFILFYLLNKWVNNYIDTEVIKRHSGLLTLIRQDTLYIKHILKEKFTKRCKKN